MKIQQWLFELLRKQSVTDGRTDAQTDARTDNVKTVYPLQTKFAGGIIRKLEQFEKHNSDIYYAYGGHQLEYSINYLLILKSQ